MCVTYFAYDALPGLLLLLTFNRDEYFSRPTKPTHFWEDSPHIIAGRDVQRGGTWLGMTVQGRFAVLTNFREPGAMVMTTDAPSRGALTTDFLNSELEPVEYLRGLPPGYAGYNLVVGDLARGSLAYLSNKNSQQPQELSPGWYGLSNAFIQQWPKVQKGRRALEELLQKSDLSSEQLPWEEVFTVLSDPVKVSDRAQVPLTGVGEEVDHYLSSIFIEPVDWAGKGELYGTRSQTVIAVWQDGRMEVRERYVEREEEGAAAAAGGGASWPWKEARLEEQLHLQPQQLWEEGSCRAEGVIGPEGC